MLKLAEGDATQIARESDVKQMGTVQTKQRRIEFGDFQTPDDLARDICGLLSKLGVSPAVVIEPTCGTGAFLRAAETEFADCQQFLGYEINSAYVSEARTHTTRAKIVTEDFFSKDWTTTLDRCLEPILVLGNPPWVTNSTMGTLGGDNFPAKSNFQSMKGLDAITGKSNFDVSEWMIRHLLEGLAGRSSILAMLCKTIVARKVLHHAWSEGIQVSRSAIYKIDAREDFGAAVDACLLVCVFAKGTDSKRCEIYCDLRASRHSAEFGFVDDKLIADMNAYVAYRHFSGVSALKWRSGIKHDCARVMELREGPETGTYINGYGQTAELEDDYLYPMLKSSDLTRGAEPSRYMLVTQESVGADTAKIADESPLTWRYLNAYASVFDARASSIYQNRPRFSMFGVGTYTFAAWKVAISGFYKRLDFRCVGPCDERPVVLDDTCYFLPCRTRQDAEALERLLNSQEANGFFRSLVFWDAKRPITARLLSSLDLGAVAQDAGIPLPSWSD